jgi:hypothetical protein
VKLKDLLGTWWEDAEPMDNDSKKGKDWNDEDVSMSIADIMKIQRTNQSGLQQTKKKAADQFDPMQRRHAPPEWDEEENSLEN